MSSELGKFTISSVDLGVESKSVEADGIFIGRLDTCEIVLDHKMVSRIHAGINFRDSKYLLSNLTAANILTLNGRLLGPKNSDVLADGDTIQIGPFTIQAGRMGDEMILVVEKQIADRPPDEVLTAKMPNMKPKAPEPASAEGVLKVFWQKRTRDKEDWGTRLRPTEKPIPGKAMFNWRPTRDLRGQWRFGLFVWAFLLIGAIGAFAYFRYPATYAPTPLSSPHATQIEGSLVANASNGNSCTTCHTPNEPMENSCIRCHSASQFHPTNTKAHEDAGITCTVCHLEHQGADFNMNASAIASCAQCHNDNNKKVYNGKGVSTAHGGSYGYTSENGVWTWQGVYREVGDAIPEINTSATGDKDEQAKLSRQFHTIHVGRLKVPEGLKGDKLGLVSCSTCHNATGKNLDRVTPKQTCAVCHTTSPDAVGRDARFPTAGANCISCHVQHPYSGGRWSEFLTEDALNRRKAAVEAKIKEMGGQ